ncbi:titin-like [Hexamita inflata]|uniref:Titin-like n=1 Tax=Hexamita inflata TaxID=28002 RepID=A0AA86PBF4_9EUKA|nr:titin-like [Hexamita inflata]
MIEAAQQQDDHQFSQQQFQQLNIEYKRLYEQCQLQQFEFSVQQDKYKQLEQNYNKLFGLYTEYQASVINQQITTSMTDVTLLESLKLKVAQQDVLINQLKERCSRHISSFIRASPQKSISPQRSQTNLLKHQEQVVQQISPINQTVKSAVASPNLSQNQYKSLKKLSDQSPMQAKSPLKNSPMQKSPKSKLQPKSGSLYTQTQFKTVVTPPQPKQTPTAPKSILKNSPSIQPKAQSPIQSLKLKQQSTKSNSPVQFQQKQQQPQQLPDEQILLENQLLNRNMQTLKSQLINTTNLYNQLRDAFNSQTGIIQELRTENAALKDANRINNYNKAVEAENYFQNQIQHFNLIQTQKIEKIIENQKEKLGIKTQRQILYHCVAILHKNLSSFFDGGYPQIIFKKLGGIAVKLQKCNRNVQQIAYLVQNTPNRDLKFLESDSEPLDLSFLDSYAKQCPTIRSLIGQSPQKQQPFNSPVQYQPQLQNESEGQNIVLSRSKSVGIQLKEVEQKRRELEIIKRNNQLEHEEIKTEQVLESMKLRIKPKKPIRKQTEQNQIAQYKTLKSNKNSFVIGKPVVQKQSKQEVRSDSKLKIVAKQEEIQKQEEMEAKQKQIEQKREQEKIQKQIEEQKMKKIQEEQLKLQEEQRLLKQQQEAEELRLQDIKLKEQQELESQRLNQKKQEQQEKEQQQLFEKQKQEEIELQLEKEKENQMLEEQNQVTQHEEFQIQELQLDLYVFDEVLDLPPPELPPQVMNEQITDNTPSEQKSEKKKKKKKSHRVGDGIDLSTADSIADSTNDTPFSDFTPVLNDLPPNDLPPCLPPIIDEEIEEVAVEKKKKKKKKSDKTE